MSGDEMSNIVERPSAVSFDLTVARLSQAITGAGMTIFARIDHAANARDVGLAMPPATVLIYGNPKGGTPVMIAAPLAALDLPLRVLVRERDDGVITISFHPVAPMLRQAGASPDVAARLEPAQSLLLAAIAP